MPRGSRKGKAQGGRQLASNSTNADFTVYDYANAERASAKSGRMSKGATNAFQTEAKQLSGNSVRSKDTLAWYEQDLSDLDLSPDETENEENKTEDDAQKNRDSIVGRRRRKKLTSQTESDNGRVYPIDMWVVIGDWIDPEDVLTFASICRGSHIVTHIARFWHSMYKRCYRCSKSLPETLQPEAMDRIHGMRARVLRSLYIMYQPFQQRLQSRIQFENDTDCLKGATCTLMWHQNIKAHWHFFFKFNSLLNSKHQCALVNARSRHTSLLDLADIHHNPEEGNCVLQIITQNFIPFPPSVMGQVLASTSLSVGHRMRYHKLKLIFTPQLYTTMGKNALNSGTTLIMDPVLNTYILNWWDPKYPHQPV